MIDGLRDTVWQAVRKALDVKPIFASEDEVAMAITDSVLETLAPMLAAPQALVPPELSDDLELPTPKAWTARDLSEQDAALREFFKWAMRDGPWSGRDLDANDVETKAEELNLIIREDYDHAKHGGVHRESPDITEGDDWYVFAPGIG